MNWRMLRKGGASIWSGSVIIPGPAKFPFLEKLMRMVISAVVAAVIAASSATTALAAGAIAVDDEQGARATDVGYGFVTGYESRHAAERAAMKECRRHGNRNCTVAVWFETCGAYAGSPTYYGIGWGTSESEAKHAALDQCGESACRIVVSGCE